MSIIPNGANPAFSRSSFDEHTHAHTHANSTQQERLSSAFLKMAPKVKSRQASMAVTCFSEKTLAHDRHLLKDNTQLACTLLCTSSSYPSASDLTRILPTLGISTSETSELGGAAASVSLASGVCSDCSARFVSWGLGFSGSASLRCGSRMERKSKNNNNGRKQEEIKRGG